MFGLAAGFVVDAAVVVVLAVVVDAVGIVVVAVAGTARALGGAAGVVDSVCHGKAADLVADLIVAAGGSRTAR